MKNTETYVGARQLYVESCIPEIVKHKVPILFVHGAYTGSWSWERYIPYFCERGWECNALNFRGHYRSGPADLAKVRFADYVEDLLEVVKHLGGECVIIATSSGGIVTQKYLEDNAAKAVVLMNSIPAKGTALPWVDPASIEGIPPIIELERESIRAELPDVSASDFDRYFPLFGKESGTAAKQWRGGIEIDTSRVQCPVLVIGSNLDGRTPPSVNQTIAERYHGDYLCFEGVSHVGILLGQKWEGIARSINEWLNARNL